MFSSHFVLVCAASQSVCRKKSCLDSKRQIMDDSSQWYYCFNICSHSPQGTLGPASLLTLFSPSTVKKKSLTRPLRDLTAFLLNGKRCHVLTVLAAGWDLLRWLTRVTAVSSSDLISICLCFSRHFTVLRGL